MNTLNEKKDFHPLWIYPTGMIVLQIIIGLVVAFALGISGNTSNLENILNTLVPLGCGLLVFITFFIMYFSKAKAELKRLTKKHVLTIFIVLIIALVLNYATTTLIQSFNITMSNQDSVSNLLNSYLIPTIILATVLAPFSEEIVFRYSLGSLIKNKIVFVIISTILFSIIHGMGISLIPYIIMGISFSIIYLKTDRNFMASYIAHVINNIVAVIFMLI